MGELSRRAITSVGNVIQRHGDRQKAASQDEQAAVTAGQQAHVIGQVSDNNLLTEALRANPDAADRVIGFMTERQAAQEKREKLDRQAYKRGMLCLTGAGVAIAATLGYLVEGHGPASPAPQTAVNTQVGAQAALSHISFENSIGFLKGQATSAATITESDQFLGIGMPGNGVKATASIAATVEVTVAGSAITLEAIPQQGASPAQIEASVYAGGLAIQSKDEHDQLADHNGLLTSLIDDGNGEHTSTLEVARHNLTTDCGKTLADPHTVAAGLALTIRDDIKTTSGLTGPIQKELEQLETEKMVIRFTNVQGGTVSPSSIETQFGTPFKSTQTNNELLGTGSSVSLATSADCSINAQTETQVTDMQSQGNYTLVN